VISTSSYMNFSFFARDGEEESTVTRLEESFLLFPPKAAEGGTVVRRGGLRCVT